METREVGVTVSGNMAVTTKLHIAIGKALFTINDRCAGAL
jgi:hypothetical protein